MKRSDPFRIVPEIMTVPTKATAKLSNTLRAGFMVFPSKPQAIGAYSRYQKMSPVSFMF
jgi:hypothetical protein